MADSPKKTNGEDNLLACISRLEADLQEIEKARKQQALIVRVGVILILFAIFLFAWNIWNFSKDLMKSENLDQLGQRFSRDMQDLAKDPEVLKMQDNLVKKVIPEVTNQIIERFKKDIPNFRKKGEKVFANLQVYVQGYLKEELEKALAESVVQLEKELHTSYPKISAEKLGKVLKAAEATFVEQVTNALEKRIEMIYEDLDRAEKTLDKFSSLDDMKKLSKLTTDEVKLGLIESLLELGIYEINPVRGNMPSTVAQGGVK
ncbi:MAG: hypothetical protein WC637_07390 [Victivallales bacterium]|jgi:hypothetical protein